jgi:hypothetical protein
MVRATLAIPAPSPTATTSSARCRLVVISARMMAVIRASTAGERRREQAVRTHVRIKKCTHGEGGGVIRGGKNAMLSKGPAHMAHQKRARCGASKAPWSTGSA